MTALALPTIRDEAWRWSDLAALPALAEGKPSGQPRTIDELWIDIAGPRLLFVDGVYDASRSNPGPVQIGPADATAAKHALGRLAGNAGWSLTLGQDAATDPIQIVHVASGGANHLAAQVTLEEDAVASIVESYAGDGWSNRAASFTLARSARAMVARRFLHDSGFQSHADTVEIGQAASFVATSLVAGAADSRLDGHLTITGEQAFAEAGGALLGRAKQRHDAAFAVRHAAAHGQSRQIWRAVAADQAVASVAARVEVARHAQKTDGEQSLRGLLMQRTAAVNLKPELEIFADDVKCGHGATVGELDKQSLFYCASRGIPPQEARAILTRAFVADALARIGDEAVREAFSDTAFGWLSA
ncbi:SufD family Fe-S cluster assembly protein [Sphingomonas abietis]|uniref:SufD family Fe-S cluster assembly protein n=1 Tax=Sphingomonas abietis TaxID=3012344 RepID=A0ABY7NM71_9SPHN|nr:SufD family Fe-S cluster assembly protein [Sphingomonas abietis]WBO22613.1 SufD family Fe-S cluster assembly protein [Sphingomonas abietis]